MFGLTFDKLIVIGIIAVVVIGPQRLPEYAEKLGRLARAIRDMCESARRRAETELGVPIEPSEWQAQVQQYDPRRVIRQALQDPAPPAPEPVGDQQLPASTDAGASPGASSEPPRGGWIVAGGSSGHPRRVRQAGPRSGPGGEPGTSQHAPDLAVQQSERYNDVQSSEPDAASAAATRTS